jgi:phosphoglycerate dehydrogenase-like enzyme
MIGGAAIDVFPKEPKANDEEFLSPLRKFDNVILTPHIGGSTLEAQANIGLEVAEKFARYSDTGTTLSAVNFPEVAIPLHRASTACCTSTRTCRACCPPSTACSPRTTSTFPARA